MIEDLYNNVKVVNALDSSAISDGATNGAVIDTQGFNSGIINLKATAVTAGDVTGSVQEGDQDDGSDMVNIPASRIIGTPTALTAANEVDKLGFVANKRYIRVVATGANSANLTANATAVLGSPAYGAVDAHSV